MGVQVNTMLKSIEAIIDGEGHIRPLEEVRVPEGTHAIITFLPTSDIPNDTAFLSEGAWEIGTDLKRKKHGPIYKRRSRLSPLSFQRS